MTVLSLPRKSQRTGFLHNEITLQLPKFLLCCSYIVSDILCFGSHLLVIGANHSVTFWQLRIPVIAQAIVWWLSNANISVLSGYCGPVCAHHFAAHTSEVRTEQWCLYGKWNVWSHGKRPDYGDVWIMQLLTRVGRMLQVWRHWWLASHWLIVT